MKWLLFLFLLIPILCFAGQGMGPGPGMFVSTGGSSGGTEILYPTSDQQTTGWTYSSGSTYWEMVDEVTPDGDSTYDVGSDRNLYLRFYVEASGLTTENITGVTVYVTAKGIGAEVGMNAVIRHIAGTTTYSTGTTAMGTGGYTTMSYEWTQNPYTSADWEIVDLDDFAYGCVYVSPISGVARVTQVRVEVSYD